MNIYNKSTVLEYYKKHGDSKLALIVWYDEVLKENWNNPNALKLRYGGSVSILKNGRAVFDIKGNHYRLIADINYENGWVFIKFIGTHTEYDKIDANTVNIYGKTKNK